ncbi:PLEK2 protein, partial [Amia calva]|nr:PLEK2 protein [Amia calva]
QGHVIQNWKARWFVLLPDELLYYKYDGGKKDSSLRGKVALAGCKVTCPCLEYQNRPLVIKLKTQKSAEYFLEACSREERDAWAASITSTIQNLRPDSAQKPLSEHAHLELNNVSLNQVVDSMHDVHSGVKLVNHMEQGSSFKKCFSGAALVDWLVSMGFVLTRVEAVTLSSALMEENFVKPMGIKSVDASRVGNMTEQFLDDSTALYAFVKSYKRKGSVKAEPSLSAVDLSGKVVKRGYLLKQGHKRKNWKVRLFVLRAEPGFLHYFDPSREDSNPVGGFSLRGCLVSALEDNGIPSGVKGNVQGNLFKIITQNDTHYFIQATSKEEKMEWILAIKQLT